MKCPSCKSNIGFSKSVNLVVGSAAKKPLTCANCSTSLHSQPNQTWEYFKFVVFILLWIGLVLLLVGLLFGGLLGFNLSLGTVLWLWILVVFVFGVLILSNLAYILINNIYIRLKSKINKGGDIVDKRVLIFYSLFTLFMIGGSFVLSLWVFPYILPEGRYNIMFSHDGLARAASIQNDPDALVAPGYVKGVNSGPNFVRLIFSVGSAGFLCVALFLFLRVRQRKIQQRPIEGEGNIYEVSRLTGRSDYDLFFRAAAEWGVPDRRVERDFAKYLSDQTLPYYVNDFVRKNGKQTGLKK